MVKRYVHVVFALVMLMMCWEYNGWDAALADSHIPEQSIRLRIIAHSDSPRDQWIKLKIRDEITRHMRKWVQEPETLQEARVEVERHLPAFEELVGQLLRQYGFQYAYSVQLAVVDFPTKIYGSKRYPAGDYEALRVVLGQGKGENWWCVLFPPLCFIDLTTSVTVLDEEDELAFADQMEQAKQVEHRMADTIETRFFIVEWFKKIRHRLKSEVKSEVNGEVKGD